MSIIPPKLDPTHTDTFLATLQDLESIWTLADHPVSDVLRSYMISRRGARQACDVADSVADRKGLRKRRHSVWRYCQSFMNLNERFELPTEEAKSDTARTGRI